MARQFSLKALLAMLLVGMSTVLQAAPVTQQQAAAIARKFMQQQGIATSRSAVLRRSMPRGGQSGTASYYIFNATDNKGFVVVSGDDRTPQILGYADSGSLDINALPDNIKSFLQGYVDEMKCLDEGVTPRQNAAVTRAGTTHAVAPLLQSVWNQATPYNNLTPKWDNQTTVTGCVATAMAQVLYYYKYPEQTTAEIPAYSYTVNNKKTDVDAVPVTTLDWTNMLPSYTSSYTTAQATAVATLMSCVGRSVNMQYMPSNYGGSSATDVSIAPALKNYFDYSAQRIDRADYTLSAFEHKVYDEVAASRPVILSGQSTGGGHCFVIDGYDAANALFHVNWGWGGLANGYFLLSVLNPDNNSGIGASRTSDGYSMQQAAIIGIQPHAGQTSDEPLAMTVYDLKVDNGTITGACYNLTGETNAFDAAIAQVDAEGNILNTLGTLWTSVSFDNRSGYSLQNISVSSLTLPTGTSYIAPVSRVSGTTSWVVKKKNIIKVDKDASGTITASLASGVDNLSVTDWAFTGSKTAGTAQPVTITVSNSGLDYYGSVYLYVSTTDTRGESHTSATGLSAEPGSSKIGMSFTPSAAGTYHLWLCAYEGTTLKELGSTMVDIAASSSQSTSGLTLIGIKVNNDNGTVNKDGYSYSAVYGRSLSGTVTVSNSQSTDFVGNVILCLMGTSDQRSYSTVKSITPTITVPANGSATFNFNFDGLNATGTDAERSYGLFLYYGSGESVSKVLQAYYLQPAVITYTADGTETVTAPAATLTVPAEASAVDLTDVESTVTTVTPNDNPNTLYFFGSANAAAAQTLKADGYNVIVDGEATTLSLADGHDFYTPTSFTAQTATFKRTLPKGTDGITPAWYSISLPFTAQTVTAGGQEKQWFTSATDQGKHLWVMTFAELDAGSVRFDYLNGTTLEANTPYIIAVPGNRWGEAWNLAGKELTFTGTNVTISADAIAVTGSDLYNFVGTTRALTLPAYILDTDDNNFVYSATGKAQPFTAYFTTRQQSAARLTSLPITVGGGEATAINDITTEVEADAANGAEYNLAGQRVDKNYRGIVIKNGKKMIRK